MLLAEAFFFAAMTLEAIDARFFARLTARCYAIIDITYCLHAPRGSWRRAPRPPDNISYAPPFSAHAIDTFVSLPALNVTHAQPHRRCRPYTPLPLFCRQHLHSEYATSVNPGCITEG